MTTLGRGWTDIPVATSNRLHIFTPRQNHNDINERSLAVYARVATDGVLLTGDMGPSGLNQLLEAGLPGPATLLKLPHHGSRRSDPAPALASWTPDIAFVSAGRHNPYRLPHAEVVDYCDRIGLPLLRTDRHGTLVFHATGSGWQTARAGEGLFR